MTAPAREQLATQAKGGLKYKLSLHKLDARPSPEGYVVFGIDGDFKTPQERLRPRPKLTLDTETWKDMGSPTALTATLQIGHD